MATGNILYSTITEDSNEKLGQDPRVESLIKKLEETCERIHGDKSIISMKQDGTSSAYIPIRVREIIQETLSSMASSWNRPFSANSLAQENNKLLKELDRAHALLSESRRECNDINVKNITMSEKIEKVEDFEARLEEKNQKEEELIQELAHWKETFDAAENSHGLHLRAYQEGQQRQEDQLTLLETRLEDYQMKYLVMDKLLAEKEATLQEAKGDDVVFRLEAEIARLESELAQAPQERSQLRKEDDQQVVSSKEEQERASVLATNNQKLREQLRESQDTNQRLMDDVHQLTFRWKETKNKLEERESALAKDMERQTSKMLDSHQRALSASLKDTTNVKDELADMLASIQTELAVSQEEFTLLSEHISTHVEAETSKLRNVNEMLSLELEHRTKELNSVSAEMSDLAVEHESLKTKHQLVVSNLEQKLGNLENKLKESKHICEERTQIIDNLELSKTEIEYGKSDLDEQLMVTQMDLSQMKKDLDVFRSCIDAIGNVFLPGEGEEEEVSNSPHSTLPLRPKLHDTSEDSRRIKDWIVAVAKKGVDSRDQAIRSLKSEMAELQSDMSNLRERLNEADGEAKAHAISYKMLKEDLTARDNNLQEISREKNELEKLLEDTNGKKMESDHSLARNKSVLDASVTEKEKLKRNNFQLQDSINKMKYELEKVKEEKQSQEMELTTKQNNSKKLDMQLRAVEDEAMVLRSRIAELEATKQELERNVSQHNIAMASFQMKKEGIQLELKSVRNSEMLVMNTLEELKSTNRKLEADKRLLTKSLKEATDRKIKLDEENVVLEQNKADNEYEVLKLTGANVQLTGQVVELDRSLNESEHLREEVQSERDCLKVEEAALSEALGKTKHALAEVQIQRGKLNNIIVKMAQEKSDLIHEKVNSNVEITKLQESLMLSNERMRLLQVDKERLEVKEEELERKIATSEQNLNEMENKVFSLQQDKHEILTEKDKMARDKEEEMSHKMSLKNAEMQKFVMRAKKIESELQFALQQQISSAQQMMQEMKDSHIDEMTLADERQQNVVEKLKEEINSLSTARKIEATRLIEEKEFATAQFKEEKANFIKRLDKLQKMFEEKCEEVRTQYEKTSHLAAEQRAQLEASNLNARRLESELSTAEQRLQILQNKLDEVKKTATDQTESLKTKLMELSQSNIHSTSTNNDLMMTIKKMEGQRHILERQSGEVQKQLVGSMTEKDELQRSSHELRHNVISMERVIARLNETISSLQQKLKKLEGDCKFFESDATSAHSTLTKVENLHAKLISDHATLQASLTNSEREKTSVQLDLRSAQERAAHLEEQNAELSNTTTTVENKLKINAKTSQLKDQDVARMRQRVANLERERNELSLNLLKTQENLHLRGQADAAKKSELQSQVSELKSIRDSLKEEINILKVSLISTQNQISDVDTKLSVSFDKTTSLSSELRQSNDLYKEVQSRYAKILAVLSGTLNILPSYEEPGMNAFISHGESGIGDSLPSSLQCSFQEKPSTSPCKLTHIDPNSVRDAILDLQKRLSLSERLKDEVSLSIANYEKKNSRLEDEKASLESRVRSLSSSLSSLHERFDEVSRGRDKATLTTQTQKSTVDILQREKEQLELELAKLRQQISSKLAGKKDTEMRLKKLTTIQVGSEIDRKQHEMHTMELEIEKKQKEETIAKQKVLINKIQASKEIRDAEIVRLQQKLFSSQHAFKESESQLKSIRDSVKNVDSTLRVSHGKETKLLEKIKQLEQSLLDAQSQKISLNRKVEDLSKKLSDTIKERDMIDDKLHSLTRGQLESEAEKMKLVSRIQQLEISASSSARNRTELRNMEMEVREKEDENRQMEMKIMTLIQDQQQLSLRIKQIEEDVESAQKGKQIVNDLCSSLENEKQSLLSKLQSVREENLRLKEELREANFQSQRLDVIMTNQQKEKSELDKSLITSSKQNLELMKTLRELRTSAGEKNSVFKERIENMSLEMNRLQNNQLLKETQWTGKEQSYRRTISELETKVQLIEARLAEFAHKKMDFFEKAQEQHEDYFPPFGADMRQESEYLSPSLSLGNLFASSPTTPKSGSSPAQGWSQSTPPSQYSLKYPLTSTPNM